MCLDWALSWTLGLLHYCTFSSSHTCVNIHTVPDSFRATRLVVVSVETPHRPPKLFLILTNMARTTGDSRKKMDRGQAENGEREGIKVEGRRGGGGKRLTHTSGRATSTQVGVFLKRKNVKKKKRENFYLEKKRSSPRPPVPE